MVVRVIPPVGRHDLLLGSLQVGESPPGMAAQLDPSVRGLGLVNVLHRIFRGAIRIPQIGMMHFVGESDRRYENCTQRSDDNRFHDLTLQLLNAISAAAMSILDSGSNSSFRGPCPLDRCSVEGVDIAVIAADEEHTVGDRRRR